MQRANPMQASQRWDPCTRGIGGIWFPLAGVGADKSNSQALLYFPNLCHRDDCRWFKVLRADADDDQHRVSPPDDIYHCCRSLGFVFLVFKQEDDGTTASLRFLGILVLCVKVKMART